MQSVVLFAIFSRWWSFCALLKCAHRRVLTIKRNSSLLILYVQVKRGFKNKNWGLKLDVFIKLLSSSLALDWWWIIFKNCSLCSSSRKKTEKVQLWPPSARRATVHSMNNPAASVSIKLQSFLSTRPSFSFSLLNTKYCRVHIFKTSDLS